MLKLRVICLLLFLPLLAFAQDVNEELLEAARKSDAEKVKSLLAKGANVNAKSSYGVTPLGFACSRGSLDVVKVLLDNGAEVNVTDTFYKTTPFGMIMMGKKANPEIMLLLLEKGAKETDQAMNYAINNNHPNLAKVALTKGKFNQDTLDKYLRVANKKGQSDIVEALKAAGAKELPEFKIEAEAIKKYEGTFKGDGLTVVFQVKEGKLTGIANGQEMPVLPLKLHTFENAESGVVVTFAAESEKITGVTLKFPNQQMTLKKEEAK
ncbi:MAG: ankyrin repeat domain-containing protein [Blastocatellia bacterium]|nr:ankyrin repeat domain-containing protein [Blastocatellia bacterium]